MLQALARYLGTGIPVLGVNYGRVGFLTAVAADDLEAGMRRAFAGEIRTIPLATIDVQVGETTKVAVNDVVVAGSTLGRLIELGYAVGGEELGSQPCDGLIGATPTGSTAYNLSNGGPVLVWGLEAMVLTFIAPHALVIRPLVVPRDTEVRIRNETVDVETTVLIDGHQIGNLATGEEAVIRVGEQHCLLATLPGGHVLPPLRRHLRPMIPTGALPTMGGCSARCASRTSSSSRRQSSSSRRA